jgi:hypothetical protein
MSAKFRKEIAYSILVTRLHMYVLNCGEMGTRASRRVCDQTHDEQCCDRKVGYVPSSYRAQQKFSHDGSISAVRDHSALFRTAYGRTIPAIQFIHM